MKKCLTGFLALSLSVFLAGSSFARLTGDPPSTADAWCSGASGAEICVDGSGNVIPTTDNDGSLGTTSLQFKDAYVDGTAYLDAADITSITLPDGAIEGDDIADNDVDHGQLNQIVEQVAVTTLASALIAALNTTPQILVPAPGVGYFLMLEKVALYYDIGASAFAAGDAANNDLIVSYTDGSGVVVAEIELSAFLSDITTDQLRFAVHHAVDQGAEEGSFIPVDNAALVISLSDEDIGTGYGTLKIRTFYRRVPTTL